MARYEKEFVGIPARFAPPEGLDPNYRDGYLGMRTTAGAGQAAYGEHRRLRRGDLETAGGIGGIHGGSGNAADRASERGGEGQGGVRDPFGDPEFLHDFDARTPSGSRATRPDRGVQRGERGPEPDWAPQRSIARPYSNRGMTPAGFSEGWARGPMRGSR